MTHLISGGLGFIGSWLTDYLAERGESGVIVDDNRGGSDYIQPVSFEVMRHDFNSFGTDIGKIGTVWHLASPVGPVGVLSQAGRITRSVLGGLENAIRIAQQNDCPLMYVSTSEVYGGGEGGLCREDMPMLVSASPSARLEYQTAKLAGEVMALNSDVDVRIIRPFNVAGPRQRPEGGFVLARWVKQVMDHRPITVYLPGTQKRAMTHVWDIVEGMLTVWEKGQRGVYNIGNPDNVVTMTELAAIFLREWTENEGMEMVNPMELHGPSFREAADKFPDASKAMAIGWKPTRSIVDIIWDLP